MNRTRRLAAAVPILVAALGSAVMAQDASMPPLPIETTGRVEKLPASYPDDWFLVHDAAFFHMSDGKVYVIDSSKETVAEQVQGTFNVSFIGNIAQSRRRGEIYATETFHSRGTRGTRTDTLTIWDMATLSPRDEVVWPTPKRFQGMPERYAVTPIDNDNLLLVTNFTPATSVTVIDLDTRKILGEVATPGCFLAFPTGKRGFSSLCADGRFMSTQLDSKGKVLQQTRTEPFFNSDKTPIFEHPAIIDGTAYFPSFTGEVHPVDMRGNVAIVGDSWQLVADADERAANWRPGGIGLIDQDAMGRFYVLMHPDGGDGTHQGGGSEVWVFDPVSEKRVLRIPMQAWGLSLAVSRGREPKVLVTNPTDMSLELYDGRTGKFLRSVKDFGQETPLMLHASFQD
jgi:methylamine dehydrogenase heavy chain